MIVYRVVSGKAWSRETVTQAESSVVFGNGRRVVRPFSEGLELKAQSHSNGTTTLGGSVAEKQWDSIDRSV